MSGGQREVAVRVFATEYDDAAYEYAESDEERAPKYIVTPGGARINRLFIVGVLTSVERINEETVRARVADPTGAFVIYAGQYQPEELAFLERAEPPMFVAVTGKANAFRPDDSNRVLTSVRPERINEVDADTRDRWVISTAQQTLDRIERMAQALEESARGDALVETLTASGTPQWVAAGIDRALDHYDTGPDYLGELRRVAIQALEVVAGQRDEAEPIEIDPAEKTGVHAIESLTDLTTAEQELTAEKSDDPGDKPEAVEAGDESDDDTPAETQSGEEDESSTVGDDDELYQVDEEERERIKAEHGLEFASGNDIEEPDQPAEPSSESDDHPPTADPPAEEPDQETPAEADTDEEQADDDVDVADVQARLLDQMEALDDSNGVDTEELIQVTIEETDASREAIEEAIDEALMSGKCYEPEDGRLKRI